MRVRASHAATRPGKSLAELIRVERDCSEDVHRLKNLAERVILTKAEWGDPSLEVDEITPLWSFTSRDGVVYYQP